MVVRIRLSRGGRKKMPHYRVVVADVRTKRDGKFIERVGHYHPTYPSDHEGRVVLEMDAINSWISKGAIPSDRVARLIKGYKGVASESAKSNEELKKSAEVK